MELTDRERAAVQAGLRLLQQHRMHAHGRVRRTITPDNVITTFNILNNCRTFEPLKYSEIDALCEKLNQGTPTLTVQIEVCGGVASVTSKPDGVEVCIVDYDTLEAGGCPICGAELDRLEAEEGECETCGGTWEV